MDQFDFSASFLLQRDQIGPYLLYQTRAFKMPARRRFALERGPLTEAEKGWSIDRACGVIYHLRWHPQKRAFIPDEELPQDCDDYFDI